MIDVNSSNVKMTDHGWSGEPSIHYLKIIDCIRTHGKHHRRKQRNNDILCGVYASRLTESMLYREHNGRIVLRLRPLSEYFPSYFPSIFTQFGSFVTLSSRHPSRATWTRRMHALPLPPFLPYVLDLQTFKLQAVCTRCPSVLCPGLKPPRVAMG
jgi:hypothetical protein